MRIDGQLRNESRGRILGRNPDESLKCFLLAIHRHLYSFALRFLFFKLKQPLTNLIENNTPFTMV
jgi:hypothetical protein